MSKELRGVLTALSTPFDDNGAIDDVLLQMLVDRSVNAGVDALVAGGGTGEVAAMSDDERVHVFEIVVKHNAGRVPVVANVGALTAKRAIRLAQAAEQAGADVVMLAAPYYEALTIEEITQYFTAVAASIKIPVMLYNNPGVTGVNLDAETLAAFGRDIDNVRYVKDSSGDWEQALRLIHYHRDDISLIMGWDSYSFSALLEGATGVMAGAANVIPDEIVAVVRALREGDVDGAREQWRRVYPVIDALLQLPFSQAVKAGLRLQGVPVGSPREPFLELPASRLTKLEHALKRLSNPTNPPRRHRMTTSNPYIVREDEAKVFYEGPELCREYLRNEALWFGSSLVNPGDTGDVDPGHEGAWEVFYCVSGEGIIDDGSNEYPLAAGDVLAVPPSVPHRIHNRGAEPVLMVWAGGPGTPPAA